MGLEGQRRRSLSRSGKILVGLVGLASLPLLGLGVLVGLEWKLLVAQVGQVGLGDLVNQDLGWRGPRRGTECCSGTIHQQALAPLVGLAVLGDQLGRWGLAHLEVLGVPWLQEVPGGLGR